MTGSAMREILLHGGPNEAFDASVVFARRMAESFGARLHVLYTVEDPLSSGWTMEVNPERLPELHEAIEAEARERLARIIPLEEQQRLDVQFTLSTGPIDEELVRYTLEHSVDLAILQVNPGDRDVDHAEALLERGRCAVLVLR